MLAMVFAVTSSLLIEVHFEIGGERTVDMIIQINEAIAEYSEYDEITTDDGSDNIVGQSNESNLADEVSRENNSIIDVGEDIIDREEEVRRPVFPFWTKYHLLFAAVRTFKFSRAHINNLKIFMYLRCWASCAVLNASFIC